MFKSVALVNKGRPEVVGSATTTVGVVVGSVVEVAVGSVVGSKVGVDGIDRQIAVATACFAPAASHVEAKVAGRETTGPCFWLLGEQQSNRIERF
jgi:hypothetical protein